MSYLFNAVSLPLALLDKMLINQNSINTDFNKVSLIKLLNAERSEHFYKLRKSLKQHVEINIIYSFRFQT